MTSIKSLLRLALVAVGLLFVSSAAEAAPCFWVGGTATWDNTNTGGGGTGGIKWASTSGGSTACVATSGPVATVPGPSDTVTFDGNSGGGTVTVNGTAYSGCTANVCMSSLTTSAFTGTINWATNTQSMTWSNTWTDAASGVHTLNLGSGTFTSTLNGTGGLSFTTSGNLTCTCSSEALVFSNASPTAVRGINPGDYSFGSLTVTGSGAPAPGFYINGTGWTFSSITNGTCQSILFLPSSSGTITNAPTWNGNSTCQILISTSPTNGGQVTLTISSGTPTITWAGLSDIKFASGAVSPTNSFDLGGNNMDGGTITPPSGGSSATGKIFP